MTKIEECFGPGTKMKDLTEEQIKELRKHYNQVFKEKMTTDEHREYVKLLAREYRKKHRENYKAYQQAYREERRQNDPEFKKRTNEHSKAYYARKKARAEQSGE